MRSASATRAARLKRRAASADVESEMTDAFDPIPADATREQLLARIEQLRSEALHDPLTGVANRALFKDRLERARAYARRTRHKFAVVVLDLDGFKAVNDTFGHEAGDALLRATARRLGQGIRTSDTVGRLGGDEFGMVLFGTDRVGADLVAHRLRVELSEVVSVGDVDVSTGVSIGYAVFPDDGTDPFELLRTADSRMYRDKRGESDTGVVAGTLRGLRARLRRPGRSR